MNKLSKKLSKIIHKSDLGESFASFYRSSSVLYLMIILKKIHRKDKACLHGEVLEAEGYSMKRQSVSWVPIIFVRCSYTGNYVVGMGLGLNRF